MTGAIFIDFYGTVVYEDGEVIDKITRIISDTGNGADTSEIGGYWWNEFRQGFMQSHGDSFVTQRELEYRSLCSTCERFGSTADAAYMSGMMFDYWQSPPIFPEAKAFFEKRTCPVYIVSNIDRCDIEAAMAYHGIKADGVFTSEDARAYKPHKDMFLYALKMSGADPSDTVHIGDSLSSDVRGAVSCGIRAVWVNRSGKEVPDGVVSVNDLLKVYDVI